MRLCTMLAAAAVLSTAARAEAWGLDVHRYIMQRAIALLPAAIQPLYRQQQAFIVEHSVDPDLWRTAGFTEEGPRHFVDLDAYGPYPFAALPREFDAAVAKFGSSMVAKNGLLPWRTADMVDRLTNAFRQCKAGGRPYALDDVQFFSAVVSHYVADGHVPFHATLNYDGQFTGQKGIHARFETDLFERYRERLTIQPSAAPVVTDVRSFMFDRLLQSFRLVAPILDADRAALRLAGEYDDRYFDELRRRTQPILEQRLSDAIAAVASVIAGAWTAGGQPGLTPVTGR